MRYNWIEKATANGDLELFRTALPGLPLNIEGGPSVL